MSKEGLCREDQTRGEEGRRDREVKEKGEERGKERENEERREEGHLGAYLLDCEFVFLFLILCIQFLF